MQVISVNIGRVRRVAWKGNAFDTAFLKGGVRGRIDVTQDGLAGDEHANTANHGGVLKAVLAYSYEHYTEFWRDALTGTPLPYGSFGENLTTLSWRDEHVHVGDTYRVGTALMKVTIPRKPCYKLNARLGRDDVLPLYLRSRRTGFYLSVVESGEVGAGDGIELLESDPSRVTPRDIVDLYLGHSRDRALLERALRLDCATDRMRRTLVQRFEHFAPPGEQESEEF
jgi:MOSC domain-containing protein YiiM